EVSGRKPAVGSHGRTARPQRNASGRWVAHPADALLRLRGRDGAGGRRRPVRLLPGLWDNDAVGRTALTWRIVGNLLAARSGEMDAPDRWTAGLWSDGACRSR